MIEWKMKKSYTKFWLFSFSIIFGDNIYKVRLFLGKETTFTYPTPTTALSYRLRLQPITSFIVGNEKNAGA